MTAATVILDHARDAAPERAVHVGVGHGLLARVAGELDARKEPHGLGVVQSLHPGIAGQVVEMYERHGAYADMKVDRGPRRRRRTRGGAQGASVPQRSG